MDGYLRVRSFKNVLKNYNFEHFCVQLQELKKKRQMECKKRTKCLVPGEKCRLRNVLSEVFVAPKRPPRARNSNPIHVKNKTISQEVTSKDTIAVTWVATLGFSQWTLRVVKVLSGGL